MSRAIEFKKSFDRLYGKLGTDGKEGVDEAVETLFSGLEAGKIPHGLGLKRLKDDLWEIRVGLHLRVGFRMNKRSIEFGVVGDHDTIKRFLRNF